MNKKIIISFFLATSISLTAQEIRGLYISSTDLIIGNQLEEKNLLEYSLYNQINYLCFYSLRRIDFKDKSSRERFRAFVKKAKSDYGIQMIGAVSESLEGFTENIHFYNTDPETKREDRIDFYNLEFEFWSETSTTGYYCDQYLRPAGYACDPDGAFSFVMATLRKMRELAVDVPGLQTEMYVGWINSEHAAQLAPMVDRILFAVYREMDASGNVDLYHFNGQRERLSSLGQSGKIEVMPIFSAHQGTTDPSLHDWLLRGHTTCEAWDLYAKAYLLDTKLPNKKNISLTGYQWFKYNSMPKIPVRFDPPDPILGPLTVKAGSTVSYSIPGVNGALMYEWYIGSDQRKLITPADETIQTFTFRNPGPEKLKVRALGCGWVSSYAELEIDVGPKIILTGVSQIENNFNILVSGASFSTTFSTTEDFSAPFNIEFISSTGRVLFEQTFDYLPSEIIIPTNYSMNAIILVKLRSSSQIITKKILNFHR